MVTKPKRIPKIIVARAKNWSKPLALPPKRLSAPPPMEPDNPALFPDCITTLAIKATQMIASIIIKAVLTTYTPIFVLGYILTQKSKKPKRKILPN